MYGPLARTSWIVLLERKLSIHLQVLQSTQTHWTENVLGYNKKHTILTMLATLESPQTGQVSSHISHHVSYGIIGG